MPLGSHPFFRKAIVPWYDADALCVAFIVLTVLAMLFGFLGIYVAQGRADYREHLWVPMLLAGLSAGVAVSTAVRMIRRR
jgi:uncharacterized membrane protein